MKYLCKTVDLMLTLEAGDSNIVKWWVERAYSIHPDNKIQTVVMIILVKGAVYAASPNQKINRKILT